MKQFTASVTERGQVTLPAEMRRALGIETPGKVTFVLEDGAARIVRPRYTIRSAAGAVTPISRPEDFEAISRIAKEEKALRTYREMHQR